MSAPDSAPSNTGPTLLTRVISTLIAAGRILPPRFAWVLGGSVGYAFGCLPMRDQRRCREHLARAFPEQNQAWIEHTARKAFRHVGRMAAWTLATLHRPPQVLRRHCAWHGRTNMAATRAAQLAGKGTLILAGHLGNWELLARVTGTIMGASVLGKRMRNPALDHIVRQIRGEHGNRALYQEDGVAACVRELRSGQLMATLIDQDIRRLAGCFVPWFGHPAYTPSGPVMLALLARAPVQSVHCLWDGRRWAMHWGPRWVIPRDCSRDEAVAMVTAQATAFQEHLVRLYPEQWVWWHKRWRTQPSDEPSALCWPKV
ncbi:MAG: hypothetical protein PF961_22955 [Planctomycetota bacterium]|jgi:KDO2-lipid IV(A) lauroyltransferase|nr:hypothetical protein [Planctomycetota bacterium]